MHHDGSEVAIDVLCFLISAVGVAGGVIHRATIIDEKAIVV